MNPISEKNWKVGALLAVGLLLLIVPHRAAGQSGPAEDPSNVGCLERLELPEYPILAHQARIEFTQTVIVLLSGQATIQNVEQSLQGKVYTLQSFFKEGAEKALKNSRFSKTCGGKRITLVFHYEIRDDETTSLFAFGPPNHFWIRSRTPHIMP